MLDSSLSTGSHVRSRHNSYGGKIATNCPGFSGKGAESSALDVFLWDLNEMNTGSNLWMPTVLDHNYIVQSLFSNQNHFFFTTRKIENLYRIRNFISKEE